MVRMEWMSLVEAAGLLGVSRERVRQLAVAGHLDAERKSGGWLVKRASVLARREADRPPGRPPGALAVWALLSQLALPSTEAFHPFPIGDGGDPSAEDRWRHRVALYALLAPRRPSTLHDVIALVSDAAASPDVASERSESGTTEDAPGGLVADTRPGPPHAALAEWGGERHEGPPAGGDPRTARSDEQIALLLSSWVAASRCVEWLAAVDPNALRRARGLIRAAPPPGQWPRWLEGRAELSRWRAHPGVLDRFRTDSRVSVGGAWAAAQGGADISPSDQVDAYVSPSDAESLAADFRLVPDKSGNVLLRVVPDKVPAPLRPSPGRPVAPVVAALDLADSDDARARALAEQVVAFVADLLPRPNVGILESLAASYDGHAACAPAAE